MSNAPVYLYSPLDRAMGKSRDLNELLGGEVRCWWGMPPPGNACWIGWGRKPSGLRAKQLARKFRMKCLLLEDGFLRSLGPGPDEKAYSVVADDLGIYYDAECPSRLESLIQRELEPAESRRAKELLGAWRDHRVSKYNHARDFCGSLPANYVLAVDQTAGDDSIRRGWAARASFLSMLTAALDENPGCTVMLKIHPETVAGSKRGHFDINLLRRNDRVRVLADDVHPAILLQHTEAVYTVTSQVGFEALLWGKPVRTFGMPFYAGWHLTKDERRAPERRGKVPLENLVHAALVEYSCYLDPETGRRCEPERLIEWIGWQRRMRSRFPERLVACGFSAWKHRSLKRFFAGTQLVLRKTPTPEDEAQGFAVWSSKYRETPGVQPPLCLRVEDGFIRSAGLGADLVEPLSWVIDPRGIYYDPTHPSELEHLLQTTEFSPALLLRAQALRRRILELGLTKYNTDTGGWERPPDAEKVILVVGQVETDASIHLGTTTIRTNLGLLREVRHNEPCACVIYKPHPDVAAGLRLRGKGEDFANLWCNHIVTGCSLESLFPRVDEVHVLTSLTGFEALLRGKKVVTYGQPFYAGWGLTTDRSLTAEVAARRTRKLSLDELVAATLILYPTYISRSSGAFTVPERTLDELVEWMEINKRSRSWSARLLRALRRPWAN